MALCLIKDMSKFHDFYNMIFQKYDPKRNLNFKKKNQFDIPSKVNKLDIESPDNMEKNVELLQLIVLDIIKILLAFSYFSTYSEIWWPPNFPLSVLFYISSIVKDISSLPHLLSATSPVLSRISVSSTPGVVTPTLHRAEPVKLGTLGKLHLKLLNQVWVIWWINVFSYKIDQPPLASVAIIVPICYYHPAISGSCPFQSTVFMSTETGETTPGQLGRLTNWPPAGPGAVMVDGAGWGEGRQ